MALGLRQIGKSVLDMPNTIEDLRLLSKEYMRNLGGNDDLREEQIYLSYIEEHLNAQERVNAAGKGHGRASPCISPIRNLAEFYQRKLNKISGEGSVM